jgi:hypothetical protein
MAQKLKTRTPFAQRTKQLVEVPDLSGGLDLRRSPTLVGANRARVMRNFSLREPGALVMREGYTAYSSNTLGGDRIQGGQRAYLGSTQITLIAYGGAVYEVRQTGVINSTSVHSTISATAEVFFPYDRQLVAVMDGANRPRKSTDGVTWTRMGIDAPSANSTLSSVVSSGNLLANTYEIGFTYKDRGLAHESNVGSTQRYTMGSTGSLSAQIVNSSDAQVDAIVTYARNVDAGETVLRKVSSQAQSGGVNSTILIQSSGWSANAEAPTNHNVPGAYEFGIVWKNRWWAKSPTVGNRLHFTELFQNQSWPTLFYIDIPFEKGDEITALSAQGDTLIVWGQSKPFVIFGQTSLDFEVRPSAGALAGALGPRAVEAIEQGILHASAEGKYVFDGATDKLLSFDIEPAWRDLIQGSPSTSLSNVAVVYEFRNKEVRCALPRIFPRGTRGEFVLDLNRTRETETPAWTDTDRDIAGYIHFNGDEPTAGNRGRLITWPSSGGRLFEESTGYSANSSQMTAEYEGPHISLGLHRARLITVRGEYEPHAGAFNVEPVLDEISQGAQGVVIGSGIAQYGTGVYGTAVYGGSGRRMFANVQPLSAEGRTVWIKASYAGMEPFRLFTYSFEIVPESGVRSFSD